MTAHSVRLLSLITIVVVAPSLAAPDQVAGKKNVPTAESRKPPAASAVAGALAHLAERLQALCRDKSLSYQTLLHDASHLVRDAALDQPWDEVEAALGRQGLRQMSKGIGQYRRYYKYLVNDKAWIAGDGTSHAMYLEFTVDERRRSDVRTAKSGCVIAAAAGLFIEPNRPYEQVLASTAYPKGTVVFLGLRLPESVEAARRCPVVNKIDVTYDLIQDRWAESVPQGFHLHLTFGTSVLDDHQGKLLSFTTQSGLDGLQDWEGKLLKNESKRQDTIGELQFWGSNEWKQTN